jgi:macrolide transport system ATP-binding/permease protein
LALFRTSLFIFISILTGKLSGYFSFYQQRGQECQDMGGLNLIDNLTQDLRFAARQLWKTPGFTFTAILMLALGLCSSVAIFAFVDAALLKPLPYRDASRLVAVYEHIPQCPKCNLSYQDYLDWKKLNTVFSQLEAYDQSGFIMTTSSGAEPVLATRVSAAFFRALGVTPVLGRDFFDSEDLPGAAHTVMLTNAAWMKRFGGDPRVVGQTVTFDDTPYEIIGVLPREFHFAPAEQADFWTTLNPTGFCEQRRGCHNLYGVARLKDGVSVQAALADTKSIAEQLEKQYPDSNKGQGANVIPLTEAIVGDIKPVLLVLLGGAGLLLLIACVNISSLLLVRSESRGREIAIRGALGASRGRLTRQFATEGLVLVGMGGLTGMALALLTMRLLTHLVPKELMSRLPFLEGLGLNPRVAAFAGAILLFAAILFTATPAIRACFQDLRYGLAEGSRGSAGNAWRRLGSKLVALELAVAVVLLVGAGLLGQSLYRLLRVDLGFQPDHLATLRIGASDAAYGKDPQALQLGREITNRISALPGVKSVGTTSDQPVSFNGDTTWVRFVGRPYNGEHNEVNERTVSSGYFRTIQARLLRGRDFTEADGPSKPRVAIVNQTLAKTYYPDEDPIGKQIGDTDLSPNSIREIVGVVDDIREGALDSEIWPAQYIPFNQDPGNAFALVVRTSQREQLVIPAMTAAIKQFDPGIVTFQPASMEDRISNSPSVYLHRSSAWLVGAFAGMALLLSVVGLYGVIAYSVSGRTREIGVRMALGASRRAVYGLILKEAGGLAVIGLTVGVGCSLATAALIRDLLFGVRSWNVPTLIAVVVLLAVSALLASFVPARRAASVNPVEALRSE